MIPLLIMAGMQAAQGLEKGRIAKDQAKTDKITAKSNTRVQNQKIQADNTLAAARGSLARYQQARNNKYKLEAGADAVESQTVNLLRAIDTSVSGGLEARIAASEEAGALIARAGAAGVGGNSITAIENTNRVRQERVQQMRDKQLSTAQYDVGRNIEQTIHSTILGLDDIQFNDNINYMQAQEPYIKEPSWLQIGAEAGMQFAQTYNSMGGFQGLGGKISGWFGSSPSGSETGGYSPQVLGKWSGPSTQLK